MTAKILDGKALSEKILATAREKVAKMSVKPKLVVVQVGNDPASAVYIRKKREAATSTGFLFEEVGFDEQVSQNELLAKIHALNGDQTVHGILVQLPIPRHLSVPLITRAIDPAKDVDGFCAYNLGKVFLSRDYEDLPPATPLGVIKLLDEYKIDVQGLNAVVVGHSNIVGKPLAVMLLNRNATVTVCHIHTRDLASYTRQADLLAVGVGKPKLITADMVKDGAIVVDIGMNRDENGKLCGDVDYAPVAAKASFITPVPGGVGPMTVASLILNTLRAKEKQESVTFP